MKIAIFHPEFAYSGGAERMTFEQISYFKSIGWEVDCYTAFVDRTSCYPEEIVKYKVKQILPEFLNGFVPHQVMVILTTLVFPIVFPPYCILHTAYYDVFLGENQAAPWWAFIASKLLGRPFAVYLNYPARLKNPLMTIDKFIVRCAAVCFADGRFAQKVCEKTYGRRFVNCPGGTKKGIFNKIIWESRWKNPYILITNRHFPAKRLEWGIEIFNTLAIAQTNLRLLLTGAETAYTRKLKALVRKYKLQNRIEFLGLVDEKRMTKLYKSALCYIYTAPNEDFGLGILEAMSYGVPTVAWNSSGPKYIVKDNQTGFLATPGDLADFTAKIKLVIDSKNLNLKVAQEAYKESINYSWRRHCKILSDNLQDAEI